MYWEAVGRIVGKQIEQLANYAELQTVTPDLIIVFIMEQDDSKYFPYIYSFNLPTNL